MNGTALRAAVAVAGVYGYFLIFAQFSFIELLRARGVDATGERIVLGVMAMAGIAGGFFAAWRGVTPGRLRIAMGVAGICAVLAPLGSGMPVMLGVALASGAALGLATVTLSALLPGWCGVAWVGLGTGLGYACCNLPWVFTQAPPGQAWAGAGFACVAVMAVPHDGEWQAKPMAGIFPWWGAVLVLGVLVALDSSAFFIIQHVADLKAGTWGDGLLWRNAVVHFVVALGAGWWLARGGARSVLVVAWVLLAMAAMAVNATATRSLAGWWYPAGVSLYSTALVAWPGWFSGADGKHPAAWRAASLFALAGWVASTNGIGMAQSLNRVPVVWVALSGLLVIGTVLFFSRANSWRAAAGVGGVILALGTGEVWNARVQASSAVGRGRLVYLSEGCLHCHSQYIRPGVMSDATWGSSPAADELCKEQPVIIGNRRQGPDLSRVGARRSAAWMRAHFLHPQMLVPGSSMPCYAPLFADARGEDLIAYLQSTAVGWLGSSVLNVAEWRPGGLAHGKHGGHDGHGELLFSKLCVACHGGHGRGDGPLAGALVKPPRNLVEGPFLWTAGSEALELRVARVIKFGILGTDMPGHEVLTDADVLALTDYLLLLRDGEHPHQR